MGRGGGNEPERDLESAIEKVNLRECDQGLRVEGDGHCLVPGKEEVCAAEVEGGVHFCLGTSDFGHDDSFVERYCLQLVN